MFEEVVSELVIIWTMLSSCKDSDFVSQLKLFSVCARG